jgi:hypothetical protein
MSFWTLYNAGRKGILLGCGSIVSVAVTLLW